MQSYSSPWDLEETILLSEIDLEIGLRERLAATLESRIKWASLLQEALTHEAADVSEVVFKDAALNALSAIDSTSDILFTRENFIPASVIHNASKGRPAPKEKPLTRSQKAKFIYLRSSPTDTQSQNQVYVLRCPICLRTSFTNLQGLYNHARITHNAGWGTHEECVRVCSVLKEKMEAELGHELDLEAGIDISAGSNMLPGVKSLFQMAVEGTRDRVAGDVNAGGQGERSVHLTKTLGLHGDSPALAQFLGKEARRKEIKVRAEDENAEVDIDGMDDKGVEKPKRRWRRPTTHHYGSRGEEIIDLTLPTVEEDIKPVLARDGTTSLENSTVPIVQSSRFRMTCRVTITDSSLFIPPERRPESARDHTHKWMVSVESASYSVDLTTVLTSMTVTSIPLPDMDPMDFVPIPALTATEPPFLVVGTTSEPFHAQIELVFNPGGSTHGGDSQRIILEHWVGLDMLGTSKSPVKGDEQMVDVELDKDTETRPAKTGYPGVNSRVHWETKNEGEVKYESEDNGLGAAVVGNGRDIGHGKDGREKEIGWEDLLKSLLPRFPMTLKDATIPTSQRQPPKRSKASNANNIASVLKLPYKLVANQEELNDLVMGRRKAIEWGRAKALRDAYAERVNELRPQASTSENTEISDSNNTPANPNLVPLTTGDVFCWLEDNNHFFRESPSPSSEEPDIATQEESTSNKESRWNQLLQDGKWCKVCGLGLWAHGIVEVRDTPNTSHGTEQNGHGRMRRASTSSAASTVTTQHPPPQPGLYDAHGVLVDEQTFKCNIVPSVLQLSKLPIVNVERIFLQHVQRRKQQIQAEADADVAMDVDADGVNASTATQTRLQPHPFLGRQILPSTPATLSEFGDTSAWQKRLRNRDLVAIADPRLSEALRDLVGTLNLRTFRTTSSPIHPEYPLSAIASSSSDVDATLAPYSVLALALKQFVRYLVKEGLEINVRDKGYGLTWMQQNNVHDVGLALSGLPAAASRKLKAAAAAGTTGGGRRERERERAKMKVQTTRVLTPMQILAGVISGYVKAGNAAAQSSTTPSASSFASRYTTSATGTARNGSGISKGSYASSSSSSNQAKLSTAVAVFGCLARLGIGVDGLDLNLGHGEEARNSSL
ncbi:hypothetical protein VKT23_018088 [Stygiomarasmius scandens]|uniref:YEATS domain-containing protein n=1 Tax=Marasmiellus scandens TaxID=2682957 RepID=A0ABR1IS23_9AGAR